jgi:hypothetical protein
MEARLMAYRLRRTLGKNEIKSEVDLDDEDAQLREEEEIDQKMIDASQFRGFSFDRWLRVIIKYAYMLVFSRRTEEAYEILKKSSECNIFYYDIPRRTSLKLAIIGKKKNLKPKQKKIITLILLLKDAVRLALTSLLLRKELDGYVTFISLEVIHIESTRP